MEDARTIALDRAIAHHQNHGAATVDAVLRTAEAFLAFLQVQPPFTPKPMTKQELSDMAQKIVAEHLDPL